MLNFCKVSIFFDILIANISWTVAQCVYVNWFNRLRFHVEVSAKLQKVNFLGNLMTITQKGNMEARQMTPFFHLLFLVLMCVTFTFVFENSQLWSVKYLNIGQKLPIWTPHHTFLESRQHPEVSKNSINMFAPQGKPKKVSYLMDW